MSFRLFTSEKPEEKKHTGFVLLRDKVEDKTAGNSPEFLLRAYFHQLSNISNAHLANAIGRRILEICLGHEKAAIELIRTDKKHQQFFLSVLANDPINLIEFAKKYPYIVNRLIDLAGPHYLPGLEEKINDMQATALKTPLLDILNDIEEKYDFGGAGKPLPNFKGAHRYGKGPLPEGRRCPQGAVHIYQEFFYRKGSNKPKTEEIAIKIIRTAAHELNHRQWPFAQNEATNNFYQKTISALVYADEKNISLLKTAIEKHNFNLSFPYGKPVTLANGKKVRLPHRVAKAYALLAGLKKEDKPDKIVALTREIANLAAEALNRPSFFGQSEGARVFYESILENLVTKKPLAGLLVSKRRPEVRKFNSPNDLYNEISKYHKEYTGNSITAFDRFIRETNAIEIINSQFKLNDFKNLFSYNPAFVRYILSLNKITSFNPIEISYDFFESIKSLNGLDKKAIVEENLKGRTIVALGLAVPFSESKKHAPSQTQYLDLATSRDVEALYKEKMAECFLTTSEFIFQMMYGDSGYYNTGKIAFKTGEPSTSAGDYRTIASYINTRPVFAANMAYQLFKLRKQMVANGKLKTTDIFNVLECGAGDGHLCGAILDVIKSMSETSAEWKHFYEHVHYTILEKSPALSERQKKNNERHAAKIKFMQGDAMEMEKYVPKESIDALISNELLDMFPPHRLIKGPSGETFAEMMVINIREDDYNKFFKKLVSESNDCSGLTLAELRKRSNELKKLLKNAGQAGRDVHDDKSLIIDKHDFLKLHRFYAADNKFAPQSFPKNDLKVFNFRPAYLDIKYFPRLNEFIQKHPELLINLRPDKPMLIALGIEDFMAGTQSSLRDGGLVVSIDYGDSNQKISHAPRTFYRGRRGGLITRAPGFIDITIDVDFTLLAEAGARHGIDLIGLTEQASMPTEDFIETFIGTGIFTEQQLGSYTSISSRFKACFQIKTKVAREAQPLLSSDEFFSDGSLVVTQEQEFARRKLFLNMFINQNLPKDAPSKIPGPETSSTDGVKHCTR